MVTGVKGNAETTYRDGDVNITKENIGLGNIECINNTTFIKGKSSEKPLRVRAIVGSSATSNVDGELYLQYAVNKPIMLGNTGAYQISSDGSEYTGNSSTATKLKTPIKINSVEFDGSMDINLPIPTKTSEIINDSNFITDSDYKKIIFSATEPTTINPDEIVYVYE